MKKKIIIAVLTLLVSVTTFAQRPDSKKITISGKVIEKGTNLPLEYATIVFENAITKQLSGGITDENGNFKFEVVAGNYNVRAEFISFKSVTVLQKEYKADTNLGTIQMAADVAQLNEIEVIAEKSTVEIKLDKRVYNVGKDMMVKGGTVSDVLDNVPSVTVDAEGTVALRGNESVKILIDGKPSGLAGINIADALKLLPADAVEKVEVITNPSARYDAEGGGGIINIVLRKGKANGVNGSVMVNVGDPETYGTSINLNKKSDSYNLFSNFGYNYRNNPGNSMVDAEYFNPDGSTSRFIEEKRTNDRLSKGYNANFGIDLNLSKSLTWTNALTFRENTGENPDNVFFNNFDASNNPTFVRNRLNDQESDEFSIEYSSNFIKKFKKEDHKLTVDIAVSQNRENELATITDQILGDPSSLEIEATSNKNNQQRNLIQTDYVLPIGKSGRFEAGYRGSFQKNLTDFVVTPVSDFSNTLEYVENVNALYTQYGSKINKFSYFLGLRFEDSHIEVNSLSLNNYNTKKHNNLFPSATVNYEFSESSSVSLSYSKRINRPRGRFLNPVSSLSSNINIFQGNPDIDPSLTDAIDLGYLKKWNKLTFNTSAYVNITNDAFQFIRKESGLFVDGVPVILSTPINLAKEYRAGFEFNLNYTPYKWWRLNGNFNAFRNETQGDYSYVDYLGNTITQNFDNVALTWFTRINSKITLPYKIDWQTNGTYNAPQSNAQGRSLGVASMNIAFSKDILKDKGTIALNVSDVFNSRKRIMETEIPNVVSSYSEMQWRERQVMLTFTYRFNKQKNERDRQPRREDGGEGDFMGRP
ncbi:outer membrane beta-barrel family protein [Flavobacterium cheniae]|uniref:Outer membrane receptor protein involved in Fe transport n=1 Tax=Flavobacterium cheniae TaxID=295428 RepID=A0A562KS79_9FLAO|nr:outer membrane beta-barrel family protein [Flavobacterium cheniae]TDR25515.1 outer membrane receptor protein involved in Fe transport [Flavobacterium cheniae]TWH98299.1 outer membrane receptor protein involved in Fe transport [Flavobacterium cheniae]